ncbi:hypothetical protein ALP91_05631 [Pseudomonas savastanoi pv. glycinea]|nr:hypothetical protein ALP91_05631 [Pseudomonas savastanoi pv. glycinea]
MGFVDEQNDRVQAALGFFDDRLEAVFELAFDPCTGLQQAQIQGVNGDALEHRRHVALHDAQRQTFHHGCFTHTRFTSQDRVVLTAAGQDVDHLPHFELASQYRIDTTIAGALGQVDGVLVQGRGLAVALGGCARACVGVGQRLAQFGLRAAFDQRAHIQAQVVSVDFLQFRRRTDDHAAQGIVIQQGLNQVAGADLRLTEFDRRQYPGLLDHARDVRRERRRPCVAFLERPQRGDQLCLQAIRHYVVVAQDHRQVVIVVVEQLQQQVLDFNVVVVLRQAQRSSAFSGSAARFVQLGEQGLQVHRETPSKGIWKTAQREGSTSTPGRLSQPSQPSDTLPWRPKRATGTASRLSFGAIWKSSSAPM